MKNLVTLATTAIVAFSAASAAHSAIMVSGNSAARTCYVAAAQQSNSIHSLRPCETALEQGLLSHRDRLATYVNRGIIYFHRSEYDLALGDFDEALAMNSDQPEALLNKAITLMRRDEAGEEALPYFTRAIELGTDMPAVAHYGRGLAYHLIGDLTSAYGDIRMAAELAPEWDAPRNDLSNFIVEPAN